MRKVGARRFMNSHLRMFVAALEALTWCTLLPMPGFGADQKAAIEGYVKDSSGRPTRKVKIEAQTGCQGRTPTGHKRTSTDQDGHYRIEVKPDQTYQMTINDNQGFAIVKVQGSETVRYDIQLRKAHPAEWCFLPPRPYLVEMVESGSKPRMMGSIEDMLPAPASERVVLPPASTAVASVEDDPKVPWWRDASSGLMWARGSNHQEVTWSAAQAYCQSLSLGEYSGWRMPTIEELERLSVLSGQPGSHVGVDLMGNSWSSTRTGNRASDGSAGAWQFWTMMSKPRRMPVSMDARATVYCVRDGR